MSNQDKAVFLAVIVVGAIVYHHAFVSNSLQSGGEQIAHMVQEAPAAIQVAAKDLAAVAVKSTVKPVYPSPIQQQRPDPHVIRINVKPAGFASAAPRDPERYAAIVAQMAQQQADDEDRADREHAIKDAVNAARAELLAQQRARYMMDIAE